MIQKNLNYLMERDDVDTATLSKELDFSISIINAMRLGAKSTTLSTLEKVADYFEINVSDFVSKNLATNIEEKVCEVPLMSFSLLDAYLKRTFIPSTSYKTELEHSKHSGEVFAVTVDRDGLIPFWEKASILIVSPKTRIKDMDMVVVRMGDDVLCVRRVLVNDDSSYIFTKLSHFDDTEISIQPNTYEIVGVILKIVFPNPHGTLFEIV